MFVSKQTAAPPEEEEPEPVASVSVSVSPPELLLPVGSPLEDDPSELLLLPVSGSTVVELSVVDGEVPEPLMLVDGFVVGSPVVSPVVPSLPVSSAGQPVIVNAAAPIER
jgi:hypothetical protein